MAINVEPVGPKKEGQGGHESEEILRRMKEIRSDLDEDVQEIVEQARAMQDWRTYMKSHPWVFVGAAVAVGYILVPNRRVRVEANATVQEPTRKLGGVLAFVGQMVFREVVSYVGRQASDSILNHLEQTSGRKTEQDVEP
jgi:hypothetical protein